MAQCVPSAKFVTDIISIAKRSFEQCPISFQALYVDVRFGRWEEIVGGDYSRFGPETGPHCVALCTVAFAKGVAFASLGRARKAREELTRLKALMTDPRLLSRRWDYAIMDVVS